MAYLFYLLLLGVAYLAIAYGSMINFAFRQYPTVAFKPGAEFLYQQAATVESPPYRFVVIGDSTAVGQGAKVQTDNFSCQYAQIVLLKKYPAVRVYNLAVSGAKTADVLAKQTAVAVTLEPDLIMVSMGANDVTGLVDTATFKRNYTMVLQQLSRTNAKIVLLNIPAFSTSPLLWEPYRSAAHWQAGNFNQIIGAIAEPNMQIVDIYRGTEPDFRRFPKLNFAQDQFHPSSAGYGVWTRVIAQTLN